MKTAQITTIAALVIFATKSALASFDGTGTIDFQSRTITVNGVIHSNGNVIVVTLTNVPAGLWTVVKHEQNQTPESWGAWEIRFGTNTIIPLNASFSATHFAQATAVRERNALVFHNGQVPVGSTLTKSFQIEQLIPGALRMSHNRTSPPPELLLEWIQFGFPQLPEVFGTIVLVEANPIPTLSEWGLIVLTISLLAVGTLCLRRLQRSEPIAA